MAQPEYVPLNAADRVRAAERIPPHAGWRQDRPAEIVRPGVPTGRRFGSPGPDQGYGMSLAERFADKVTLAPEEHLEDVMAACLPVALKRASVYGRAPVIFDLELAFTLLGFLGDAPADLLEFRVPLVQGAAHNYWSQRAAVDRVDEATLRMTPAQVRAKLPEWKSLFTW